MNIPLISKLNNSKTPAPSNFDLVEAVRHEICLINKSKQSIKNILATFNQLLKRGFISNDNLKERFNSGFEQLRCEIKAHVQASGKNRQWLSHINDIRSAVDQICAFDLSEMSFSEALLRLCKRKWGYVHSQHKLLTFLSNETSIPVQRMYIWVKKNIVPMQKKGIEYVSQLDEFFCAKGELFKKVNPVCAAKAPTMPLERYPHFPIPDKFKKQLDDYIKFRIAGTLPRLKIRFGDEMDERELRAMRHLKGKEKWTKNGAGECRTASVFLRRVQSYCNFIAKEASDSQQKVRWDINLLMDHEWLYKFKEDRKNSGLFSSTSHFFTEILHECASDSYFSAYHAFTKDKESWLREINLLKKELSYYSAELSCLIKEDRGKANIAFLLASENLEELIVAIANELDRRETYYNGHLKMSSAMIAVCFRMLLELPLRLSNMCQLKYISDFDPGDKHFIKWPSLFFDTSNNAYCVIVPKDFLKNRNSKGINTVEYYYSDFITPFIRKYLKSRKEYFKQYDLYCPYFFFGTLYSSHNSFGKKTDRKNFGTLFSRSTYRVLVTLWGSFVEKHNLKGINIHAMRHISATLFLKHHPENYTALATLLMDDLKTVISTYAQRDDQGNFKKIRDFSERIWSNQLKGGQHE